MSAVSHPQGSSPCPSLEELTAFGRGLPTAKPWEEMAEHVSTCPGCATRLRVAPDGDDTVLASLRRLALRVANSSAPGAACPPGHAAPLSTRVGRYELLDQIGQGGMGVVYRARHVHLNRIVALKMISHCRPHAEARFRVEGEAVARLRHANVVEVYDFGIHEGRPYLVMELLEGGTLADKLACGPLPQRAAAQLVRQLALAVHAAHSCRIIHRDLKPANILLGADGTAKVSDFGLAKLLDMEEGQTLSGDVLGTPSYMAPEQAAGRAAELSPLTDVYGLGAVLYVALVGRPPFRGLTPQQTLQEVMSRAPARPVRWRADVAPDLEAVCLKCLEKKPAQRYPSAEALADDLGRWLDGTPTKARPLRWPARWWRTIWRNSRRTAAAWFLMVAVAVSAAWFAFYPMPADEQVERELARGYPVTLIGDTGAPRWWHFRVGGGDTQVSAGPDGTFALKAWTVCLLELVRNPRRTSYRVRAEVRHIESDVGGEVGIFFAHREFSTPRGAVHSFVQLAFNDVKDDRDVFEAVRKRVPNARPPKGNRVELFRRLYSVGRRPPVWDTKVPGFTLAYFSPARPVGGAWRPLSVSVTPDRIEATWGTREKLGLSGCPVAELVRNSAANLAQRRQKLPDDIAATTIDPAFHADGSLGLYLVRGSACFRRVVVEPLGGED